MQYFLPPRTAELKDLVSGMVGAGIMLVGVLMVRRTVGGARGLSNGEPGNVGLEPAPTACLHCREPIQPGATRCPRCLAWQSRWVGDSQNPRLELALLVGGAAVVALLATWLYLVGSPRVRALPKPFLRGALVVVEAAPARLGSGERAGLAVVGTVKNVTATAWRDPYLQVRCFDREGGTIETFTARASGLVVSALGQAPFKVVEGSPLRPAVEYASCKVDVTWAVRAE